MVNALIIAVLVAVPTALLSCFLVLKGWSLMGDAISHAVLPGVVLAYIVGIPLAVGAFVAGMFCALATGFLKDNSRIKQDTVMGVVFSGMFGLGIVLYTKIQTDVHLDHILFGDMLGVGLPRHRRDGDHRRGRRPASLPSSGGTSCSMPSIRRRRRAIGLPVRLLHYGLLCLISLTIVGALKAVGIILAIAMLIAPGAIAFLLTRRLQHDAGRCRSSSPCSRRFTGVYLSLLHRQRPGSDHRACAEHRLHRDVHRSDATGQSHRAARNGMKPSSSPLRGPPFRTGAARSPGDRGLAAQVRRRCNGRT